MMKVSPDLRGCTNLANRLSLDQTYYTIRNCGLFITGQNGLSVLAGATDTEIIVLDMSIEWSKRAIYRQEDPYYRVTYVKGNCPAYCCMGQKVSPSFLSSGAFPRSRRSWRPSTVPVPRRGMHR